MNNINYRFLLPIFSFVFIILCSTSLLGQAQSDFYTTDKIQDIGITFKQENWRYLLDSLRYNGSELLPATVLVNGHSFANAGIRYRDGNSFIPGGRRNSLFIDLDVMGHEQYMGVGELELSVATRDPSMVREVIGLELARKYLPAPLANYAKVRVNNDYYGLLVNIEVVNEDFMKRNFGTPEGSLFFAESQNLELDIECRDNIYGSLLMDKSKACLQLNFEKKQGSWEELFQLTELLKNDDARIEDLLDVDQILWMMALNNVILNLKSYSGKYHSNYFMVKPKGGRFVMIPGRMNLAFGSYKNTGIGSDLKPAQMIRLSASLHENNEKVPLINTLLSVERYSKQYIAHIRTILSDIKAFGLKKKVEKFHVLIYSSFVNDKNRYYSTQDLGNSLNKTIGNRSKIPGIVKLIKDRRDFLKTERDLIVLPPEITQVDFKKREQFSTKKVNNFTIKVETKNFPKTIHIYYRYSSSTPFKMKELQDNKVTLIPPSGQTSLEYFFTVENAQSMSFYPANYQKEKAKVTLADLNQ